MNTQYVEFSFPRSSNTAPHAVLSLKSAGDMKYDPARESAARRALFALLGIAPERVVGITLKHTRNVAFIESKEDLRVQLDHNPAGFDGIITRNPLLVPSITVADCMPIYLHCEHCGAFGVLHSGWKGTGILSCAVEGMGAHYGCQPWDISIILGPSIGSCCYEVDGERAKNFATEFGLETVRKEYREGEPRFFLDLLEANRMLAADLGLIHVANAHRCTFCDPRFSSYRRDGTEHFQRMLALVVHLFPN